MIHVHQCFQDVGHGTFFTGLVTARDGHIADFSWVYDCGSRRTTRIAGAIEDIESWHSWPEKIDLFVLSHFDDDHVNGVERFLRTRSVRCLALPYMDAAQRLGQAAAVSSDPCSFSTAVFQLDPVQWLTTRGLLAKVDSILFVRGGQRGDNDFFEDIVPEPLPDQSQSEEGVQSSLSGSVDEQFRIDYLTGVSQGGLSGPRLMLWQHTLPSRPTRFPVEFMFFNSEQPDLFRRTAAGDKIARRSGASVEKLKLEVNIAMLRYKLTDLSKRPRRGWREALRRIFERHFGRTSQARNNISLCLLVRPLALDPEQCSIFRCRIAHQAFPSRRAGLLCLGDLRVDGDVIAEMKKHFGKIRWDSLCVVQVPHHGSRHSWETGNAAAFAPDWFVHCVPDNSTHHPHEDVTRDLSGFKVLYADYAHRVALDYHYRRGH